MLNNLLLGVGLSVISLLVYLNLKNSQNEYLKRGLNGFVLCLALLMPISTAVALSSLSAPNIKVTKEEVVKNLGKEFIEKARKELAQEHPDQLYIPKKGDFSKKGEMSKQGAIDSVTQLISEIKANENKEKVMERFKALDEDKKKVNEVVDQSTINKLYLPKEIANDEMVKNTILSLMTISTITPSTEFSPKEIVNLNEVVFDEYTKTAHIPLDIYTGRFTGIAFEMVYEDGVWKLNPYTLMRSFQLSQFLAYTTEHKKEQK